MLPQQSHRSRPYEKRAQKWVNYAIENDALIIFDAAYEAYIQDPDIPHSIYEIKGAKR